MADLNKLLFFDIETHRVKEFNELTTQLQTAFINHLYEPDSYDSPAEHYNEIAGLHAEFSHVICVSFGYEDSHKEFHVGHIVSLDEVELLNGFTKLLEAMWKQDFYLAGHNIFACDIPYMIKRYIINGIKVPEMLSHVCDCKPWEAEECDTMNSWKLGQWRNQSLEVICASLGVPCKSENISGATLYKYPINEVPLDELAKYCDEDVICSYQIEKHIREYLW